MNTRCGRRLLGALDDVEAEVGLYHAADIARLEGERGVGERLYHHAARKLAEGLGLPVGNAVDFWTEASLFSQAGLTAFVYGPGDIAQAHTAGEFVLLDQLQRYTDSITRILGT